MALLTDYTSYADAQRQFAPARLWDLFDGDRERLNIAHECIDRHADGSGSRRRPHRACRWARRGPQLRRIADVVGALAHWLAEQGIEPGDRVAIMLEPSLPFYAALFGAMKLGAIAVPLFTLFGPDGVRLRVEDCKPRLLITNADKAESLGELRGPARLSSPTTHCRGDLALSRLLRRRRRRATTWRYSSTPRARRASCRRRCSTLASRDRRRDVRGALRHRHPAGRRVLLPVIAGLGARPVARHPGAAGAGRHDRHLRRPLRSGTADEGVAGLSASPTCRPPRRITG